MSSKTPAVPLEILAVVLTVTLAVLVCSRLRRKDFRDEVVRSVDHLADRLFYGPRKQLVVVECLFNPVSPLRLVASSEAGGRRRAAHRCGGRQPTQ